MSTHTPTRRSKTRVTVTPERKLHWVKAAHLELQIALYHAKKADAPMLAGRIRAALKSCGGAIRHAKGRETAEYIEARNLEESVPDRELIVTCTHEIRRA